MNKNVLLDRRKLNPGNISNHTNDWKQMLINIVIDFYFPDLTSKYVLLFEWFSHPFRVQESIINWILSAKTKQIEIGLGIKRSHIDSTNTIISYFLFGWKNWKNEVFFFFIFYAHFNTGMVSKIFTDKYYWWKQA